MNIEEIIEAKPEGATHYDIHGDYWKIIGDVAWFNIKGRGKWTRYAFTDIQSYINDGTVKLL